MPGQKVRFEVFKRDGFTCQYCGAKPPAIVLEADHIEPKSRGGTDDSDNLITACFDCNSGKGDRRLEQASPSLRQQSEQIKERELQIAEFRKWSRVSQRRVEKDTVSLCLYWEELTGTQLSTRFKEDTIRLFVTKMNPDDIKPLMAKCASMFAPDDLENGLKYLCGCCWNHIKGKGSKYG